MRKERMNDKGFSLVELIIVIAIMAILLVVLAPQYLRYVERSRNSTDLQNATEIVTALQVYAADPEATVTPADGSVVIAQNADGNISNNFAITALTDAGLMDTSVTPAVLRTRCQSRTNWDSYTIEWDVTDGQLNFTYSATNEPGGTVPTFSQRMLGATTAAPAAP